jgi:hypothetical protein
MPLYRRVEKNAQLLEFNCIPFVEDLIYGSLRKPSSNRSETAHAASMFCCNGPRDSRSRFSIAPIGAQNRRARLVGAPTYRVPRLPDGHPDFQGFWNNTTYTPLERPQGINVSSSRKKKSSNK